jgi:hypothetical protein
MANVMKSNTTSGFDMKGTALLFADILEEIHKMQMEAYQEEMKEWKQR